MFSRLISPPLSHTHSHTHYQPITPPHTHTTTINQAIGAVAIGVGRQFAKYLPSLYPYLKAGLANHREWQVCLTTVGALTDVCDAVGEELLPYCDEIVSL